MRTTTLKNTLFSLGITVLLWNKSHAQATVSTIGGGSLGAPYSGFVNGDTLTSAKFSMPAGMAMDSSGNLYIADYTNNAVRLVSAAGDTGTSVTTTWAATGVSRPLAVCLDGLGNVYVLNHGNGANGAVLHFTGAGGTAVAKANLVSSLVNATAMAMDGAHNLFVTVNGDKVIRVTPAGVVTNIGTVSRSGTSLQGIWVLDNGNLALTDAGNNGILIMNALTGATTTLTGFNGAGDALGGPASAKFLSPATLAEAGGGVLVVADKGNNKVKLVDTSGNVTLLYGVSSNLWLTGAGYYPGWADGTAGTNSGDAESRLPYGVVVASDGSVFADEDYYDVLRHVTGTGLGPPPAPGVAGGTGGTGGSGGSGGGSGASPSPNGPAGITYDSIDNFLFIANRTNNLIQILNLNVNTNATSVFLNSQDGLTNPVSVLLDTNDNVYVLNQGTTLTNGFISEFDIYGNSYGPIVTGLTEPTAFTMDALGNIFVTEQFSNVFAFGTGLSNTIVTITNAHTSLQGIALFDDGTLAVSDSGNEVIWAINPITRIVSRLTGKIGVAGSAVGVTNFAEFDQPHQLVHIGGNQIIGADTGNNRLVLISRAGTVTTNHFNSVVGATIWFGNNAIDPITSPSNSYWVPIVAPVGVAMDSSGNVYDSENLYGDVREMTSAKLGAPTPNPGVPLPVYSSPAGMSLNNESTFLFVADPVNDTISALNLANNQTSVFLNSSNGIYEPVDVAVDVDDNVYVLNQGTGGTGSIMEFDQYGNFLGTNVSSLPMPTAMKLNYDGSFEVAERGGLVQEFGGGGGSNTLADITINANVRLEGIAVLDTGSVVVSDAGNDVIWEIAPGSTNAVVMTGILGTPGAQFGPAGFARLNTPMGIATANGGLLAIVDSGNNRIVVATDAGTISEVLNSTNADLWFGLPNDPLTAGSPNFVPMISPVSLVLDASGTVYDSESVYKVIRGILDTGLVPPIKPAPPAAPEIGWFDYEEDSLYEFVTVMHPVTSVVTFNNDTLLAIDPTTNGVSTYYVIGAPPLNSVPSATNGSTPPFYEDGLLFAQPLTLPTVPDFIIKAINIDSVNQASPVTTAEFIFQAANPTISGNNAAQFTVSDITTNVTYWYTIDGTDPTNAPPSLGPVFTTTNNSTVSFSLAATTNVLFKIRAFRNNYLPSGIAVEEFTPGAFNPNTISFGTADSEPRSSFIARPGQFYYAPVTLQLVPNFGKMYSLQFNCTVTNGYTNIYTGNPVQPIVDGAGINFFSMLMTQVPADEGKYFPPADGNWYLTLPNLSQYVLAGVTNYQSTTFVDTNNNLLGVGWLYRTGFDYFYENSLGVVVLDFNTANQDLIQYSIAHDTLFPQANGEVVLGAYSFQIPANAVIGDQYFIQLGSPSATADGVGAPGSSIYIQPPAQSQAVTIGTPSYLVGDAAPFNWLNAGDFGDTNLDNADVMQVYQSGVLGVNMPPANSDLYAAMDSSGGFGAFDSANGYYTNSGTATFAQQQAMWNGNDLTINSNAFGDGTLDINDVYVTFRRSLDPSLVWFRRYWTNGMFVAVTNVNYAFNSNTPNALLARSAVAGNTAKVASQAGASSPSYLNSSVEFMAGDAISGPGTVVDIPITANILGSYPLRVLGLNITVHPLDGSPVISNTVVFSQSSDLESPDIAAGSQFPANFNAAWLNATIPGLSNDASIGTLQVALPNAANNNSAYAVHFDFASGSPNGLAVFPKSTYTGLITTVPRTNSVYNDGIPDSWRLRWFGTINNLLSASNACPSGDGIPNWEKYVAGVDPNVAGDFPTTTAQTLVPAGSTSAISWPSVLNKHYVILRATSLYNSPWTVLSTNTGTGGMMEYDDKSSANPKFYRVEILP